MNTVPAPGALSTEIAPPITSTVILQKTSPRPVSSRLRTLPSASGACPREKSSACSSGVIPRPASRVAHAQADPAVLLRRFETDGDEPTGSSRRGGNGFRIDDL